MEHAMKHLNTAPWFRRTSGGNLQRLRVSGTREAHFPLALRKVYQEAQNARQSGASQLCRHLMDSRGLTLAQAWAECKRLFNGV
jgi:hypothetical protein